MNLDADIETEELRTAMGHLETVIHAVGDVPSLLEASERLIEAAADYGDLESFEDALRAMVAHVRSADELVVGFREYAAQQFKAGRVRVSNEEYAYLDRCLAESSAAMGQWVDYANGELAEIS